MNSMVMSKSLSVCFGFSNYLWAECNRLLVLNLSVIINHSWIQWTLPPEKYIHEHKTYISLFSSIEILYFILIVSLSHCNVLSVRAKDLSLFYIYIPSYHNSTWHIIGSPKLSTKWINRLGLLVSLKSSHITLG